MSIDPFTIQLAKLFQDYSLRRSAGELIRVIDFRLDDVSLGTVIIEGDYQSYAIDTYDNLNIPKPEGTQSDRCLKIVVKAGGTVYVRIPSPLRAFKPMAAYTDIYALDNDMNVLMYVTLGGNVNASRNKLPKMLVLPKGQWGRLVNHWFMELHHGQAEVVIEISNPDSSNAHTVIIGIVVVSEIDPWVKGFCLLFGWEGTYELQLSNETINFYIDIMVPPNIGEAVFMGLGFTLIGDGTNPLTLKVTLNDSTVTLVNASNANTSPYSSFAKFNVSLIRYGSWDYYTIRLSVQLSTQGSGKLTSFTVVMFGAGSEYEEPEYHSGSLGGGQSVDVFNYRGTKFHVKWCRIHVDNSGNDGAVNIYLDRIVQNTMVATVNPGEVVDIEFRGRVVGMKLENQGSKSCSFRCEACRVHSILCAMGY